MDRLGANGERILCRRKRATNVGSSLHEEAASDSVAHGKTVVVYLVNAGLAADKFPTFLAKADQILKSLRFPG
jgi:hypothetical protein